MNRADTAIIKIIERYFPSSIWQEIQKLYGVSVKDENGQYKTMGEVMELVMNETNNCPR